MLKIFIIIKKYLNQHYVRAYVPIWDCFELILHEHLPMSKPLSIEKFRRVRMYTGWRTTNLKHYLLREMADIRHRELYQPHEVSECNPYL